MVEYNDPLDGVFGALADPVRRDILERTSRTQLTVSQIALDYDISLAAVSKHLKVLHQAGLISRRKVGRYQYVVRNDLGIQQARQYIQGWPEV
jgi:DNA-binding transcriptional ArsR family regulator